VETPCSLETRLPWRIFVVVVVVLGLKLRAYTLSHSTNPFFEMVFFQDRVLQTIFLGWLRTMILTIANKYFDFVVKARRSHKKILLRKRIPSDRTY
jgi:hypothetical protein